jgi:hypothetical protein
MADNSYNPAGYCPHCGYAIDPGVCPECGKNVAADELDSAPYWVTRRRIIRRSVLALVILSIAAGGWYVYSRCDWIAWVPTRLLMTARTGPGSGPTRELWRRFVVGRLSPDQVEQLLADAIDVPRGLMVRSPYPAGVEIRIDTWFKFNIPIPSPGPTIPGWEVSCTEWQLTVDHQPARSLRGLPLGHVAGCTGSPNDYAFETLIPGLPPGRHEIGLVVVHGLVRAGSDFRRTPPIARRSLTLSRSVLVEDKPVGAYVKGVWEPQLARQIAEYCRLSFVDEFGQALPAGSAEEGPLAWGVLLEAETSLLPVPIVASVWFRPRGGQWFFTPRGGLWGYVAWPAGRAAERHGSFLLLEFAVAGEFDVRLVPDFEQAFRDGFTECFDGVIEWSHVPVKPSDPLSPDGFRSPTKGPLKPTRVYHATGTEASE